MKTKSIEKIEARLEEVGADSMRQEVLQNAKFFKQSWIGLGRALYAVWKDKLYKGWGYTEFDLYTRKEIGIRKQTALKLLRSYYFVEKEEPGYISAVPTLEAVDALRLAGKKKLIDRDDYNAIKKKVFEDGKDGREVKRDLTQLIREREELAPEEARNKRRTALLRRFISTLKSIRTELRATKMFPAQVLKDTEKLLSTLESGV